jgi:peptidoglycan/xylan/chitin deacetylase (PgdA/CDA1 family)
VKKANLIDPEKPMVAMTFDDGPGGYSKKLADLFTKYNGRATFFVLGSLVPNYDESLKYVYEQGHEVGSHTYSHKNLNILSKEGVQKEVDKAREAIHDAIGVYPTVTRTPYGNANKTVMEILDGPMIHWSVDTLDWQSRDTAKIEKKILGNIRNGDIVLMHEIYGFTYQAVVNTIDDLAKKGYQFVTVSELLLYNDIEPEGIIYSTKKQVTEYK